MIRSCSTTHHCWSAWCPPRPPSATMARHWSWIPRGLPDQPTVEPSLRSIIATIVIAVVAPKIYHGNGNSTFKFSSVSSSLMLQLKKQVHWGGTHTIGVRGKFMVFMLAFLIPQWLDEPLSQPLKELGHQNRQIKFSCINAVIGVLKTYANCSRHDDQPGKNSSLNLSLNLPLLSLICSSHGVGSERLKVAILMEYHGVIFCHLLSSTTRTYATENAHMKL